MSIFFDVLHELLGMFLADARLSMATCVLVAAVAALILMVHAQPLFGGFVLVFGCVAILLEATFREARRRRASPNRG